MQQELMQLLSRKNITLLGAAVSHLLLLFLNVELKNKASLLQMFQTPLSHPLHSSIIFGKIKLQNTKVCSLCYYIVVLPCAALILPRMMGI